MTAENETRNALIAQSVRLGLTYGEAAKIHGVSRNVVAGVCTRAGVKVGREGKRAGLGESESARMIVLRSWADPDSRQRRIQSQRRRREREAASA